jgi:hypothetical protein
MGGLIVVLSVVLLAVHEQRSRRPAVATPDRVEDAISVPTGQPT